MTNEDIFIINKTMKLDNDDILIICITCIIIAGIIFK